MYLGILKNLQNDIFIIYHFGGLFNLYTKFGIVSSIIYSTSLMGFVSVVISILGVSLADWQGISICTKIVIVILAYILGYVFTYLIMSKMYSEHIDLEINNTPITILYGDIFQRDGYRVIGCDTHFETRVDDVIVSKESLHGQLILKYGNKTEIDTIVENRAKKLGLTMNGDNQYDFPLGSIVKYGSSKDNCTYLMLAMTELNEKYESHTNTAKFEMMLVNMWKAISTVYANKKIILPILGNGITRFDGGANDEEYLIWLILHSLEISGVRFDSSVEIVIYRDKKRDLKKKDISLYQYKKMF